MGSWERMAEEYEKLERERDDLKKIGEDREIGIIGQAEVSKRIEEINNKLGK